MARKRRAFITGITGQDGSYLAELLLEKGYGVHGLVRASSSPNIGRIAHIADRLVIHYGDILDGPMLMRLMRDLRPNEVYNLAGQSDVALSFTCPEYTANVNHLGCVRLLDAIASARIDTRFYQASTSEMFGNSDTELQDEGTPFRPCSPYGCAKLAAHWQTVNYRQSRGMFACGGILFNHESPRRGERFVTRKITMAAARISKGLQVGLTLGNLDARRDWGYSGDYVRAMWLMLQAKEPRDYVVATGQSHSVREFLEAAFSRVGLNWPDHVKTDIQFERPSELRSLCGMAAAIEADFGWKPEVGFDQLVDMMIAHDLEGAK